jgi:hypothetical protein
VSATPPLSVSQLIDLGDLDELLRRVDSLCDDRNWDGLVDLRDRCRAAFERGRQLWPAAAHAEYRVALQAPGQWAAGMLGSTSASGSSAFSLGPLTEVVASSHTWDNLAAHLPVAPEATLVAHERVVRGEDLTGEPRVDPGVLELPLRLAPWEPPYPLATYKPYTAEFPGVPPPPSGAREVAVSGKAEPADDPEAVHALVELVTAWTTQSNGTASAVAVEGDVDAAVGALAGEGTVRLTPVDTGHAVAVMAWAAASGGAHGRRRGMAYGRFAAWWALAAVAGELDVWPDVSEAVERVRWYRWDRLEPSTGWILRLAAEDPEEDRAWALEAVDRVDAAEDGA